MAKAINHVTVTVESAEGKQVYKSPTGVLSGYLENSGQQNHVISLPNSKRFPQPPEPKQEDPFKVMFDKESALIQHTHEISKALKAAETSKLQGEVRLQELQAEIALRDAESRSKIMKAVHEAILADIELDSVIQTMPDDWAGYTSDMYDHVYISTDLDRIINPDVSS